MKTVTSEAATKRTRSGTRWCDMTSEQKQRYYDWRRARKTSKKEPSDSSLKTDIGRMTKGKQTCQKISSDAPLVPDPPRSKLLAGSRKNAECCQALNKRVLHVLGKSPGHLMMPKGLAKGLCTDGAGEIVDALVEVVIDLDKQVRAKSSSFQFSGRTHWTSRSLA